LGTTIWSPLCSGLLTGKYNEGIPQGSRLGMEGFEWLKDRTLADDRFEKVKQLTLIANELGTTTATLSIAWCIHNPNVTTAILGATKEAQLLENLKALEVLPLLTPEVIEKIEGVMNNKPLFV
jgi:aryl-alcohol dehydrogenase-like predicted oxidoreductase